MVSEYIIDSDMLNSSDARKLEKHATELQEILNDNVKTYTQIGTPLYLSPEIINKNKYDKKKLGETYASKFLCSDIIITKI